MNYNYYQTLHPLSIAMGEIISEGFGARIVPVRPYIDDDSVAMTYGILRGCEWLIKHCEKAKRPYVYIDHSYFFPTRGTVTDPAPTTYFRLVKNGRYANNLSPQPPDRWERLGITIKPFHKQGRKIVVVPMSRYVAAYEGIDGRDWIDGLVQTLTEYTDRDIVIKPKSTEGEIEGLDGLFADAHALVTHDSLSALSALTHGVPVFVSSQNPAALMGRTLNNLGQIEIPHYPENRLECFAQLAYQQWRVEEIRDGTARRMMEDRGDV